ncbi:haloalkane dehalogenase [Nocardia seriolae]|uniref:Haloalkane dehalogenase n=1 Tax=Nocardia seriolae TaxID=37332 RepID=A0A0B8NGU9_9NOCA|nr:haloalkane dehalogenase [Nocardia seriolae]MTJ63753.1 alpha/beta fold hydrolase [Nocardia seriolae]MTJ74020.1 alpha/beta fold hydrolase [Nocardia seriolae]MTJ88317.1 alpha/beta fold hydrolase [Nocardia seriolae]MTK32303.1 alpha/beta fold hydrolase [Nocardia seriolae]MTK41641.1 alpha/beta fold hydrolase [Nocardia seriolae]
MHALRTPDERFADLPDFPFGPHYLEVAAGDGSDTRLRTHYLDEGPRDGEVVLLLHGEPSWSFLYRRIIPVLVVGGLRCVAPDLIGFGRSDKPAERADYSYARHVEWLREALFDHLDLSGITLVCQDWGGLLGLRLVAEHPDRFARVVVANTGLPTGDAKLTESFAAWQRFSQQTPSFPVGGIVAGGCRTELTPDVVAAYDAPFPDESYKAGARAFPLLVPTRPDDPAAPANRAAWERLAHFAKPVLTAFSDGDPITAGGHRVFQEKVPGAAGQPHTTVLGGGHFLQEDRGPQLAALVREFIAANPASDVTGGSTK